MGQQPGSMSTSAGHGKTWKNSSEDLSITFAAFALMEFSQRVSSIYTAHLGT